MRSFYHGLLIAALLVSANSINAEIYKWTDDNGEIHYSESPPKQSSSSDIELLDIKKNRNNPTLIPNTAVNDNDDSSGYSSDNNGSHANTYPSPAALPSAEKQATCSQAISNAGALLEKVESASQSFGPMLGMLNMVMGQDGLDADTLMSTLKQQANTVLNEDMCLNSTGKQAELYRCLSLSTMGLFTCFSNISGGFQSP